jgi:hypothetical protein
MIFRQDSTLNTLFNEEYLYKDVKVLMDIGSRSTSLKNHLVKNVSSFDYESFCLTNKISKNYDAFRDPYISFSYHVLEITTSNTMCIRVNESMALTYYYLYYRPDSKLVICSE